MSESSKQVDRIFGGGGRAAREDLIKEVGKATVVIAQDRIDKLDVDAAARRGSDGKT